MPAVGRARYFADHAQYTDIAEFREALEKEAADPGERHLRQLRSLSGIVMIKYRLTQWGELSIGGGELLLAGIAVVANLVSG